MKSLNQNYNIQVFCDWQLPINFNWKGQINLFVDQIPNNENGIDGEINLLFVCEPKEINPIYKKVVKSKDKFKYIFTHDECILKKCKNSILFSFGGSWIRNYKFPKKKFGITTIVGIKNRTKGHKLRLKLWNKQKQIKTLKQFYQSNKALGKLQDFNNPILGETKNPLFDFQFNIAIENVRRNNWFTEKLIDCFITKTVPIYWGCPNIDRYFNSKGIIQANNLNEIIKIANRLTKNDYNLMQPFIEENYLKAQPYTNLAKRFEIQLDKLFY